MVFKAITDFFGAKRPTIETTPDYQRWRDGIFTVEPEQVGVSKSDPDQVYGVIMDIGLIGQSSDWAMTLSAFPTGEASFQPTVGGGIVGLGSNARVAEVAKEIVQIAQALLPAATPTQDYALPEREFVQFFFFTTTGLRVFKQHLDQMQQPESPFMPLLDRFGFIRQFADQLRRDYPSQANN